MTTVFFDLDGTLLNTQAGIADSIRATLLRLNNSSVSDERLRQCFGPPIRDSFAELLNTSDGRDIAEAVTLFRQHYLSDGIYNYQIYPGITELLQQLSKHINGERISLRVLTVKPRLQAEELLTHSELEHFFESVHGSENCGKNSNKSEHLGKIISLEPALKNSCWMIGDRANDIAAAKANQATSVAVHWGYGDVNELTEADSDYAITQPIELLKLISQR